MRVASNVGKNDEEGAEGLLVKVKARMAQANDPMYAGAGDPLLVSDGDLCIPPAVVSLCDMWIKGRPRGALEVPGRTGVLPSSIRERSSLLPSSAYSATIFSAIRSPLWAPAELGVS